MKKLSLLFIAFLCQSIYGYAQEYKSLFGNTSTTWLFEWSNIWPDPLLDSLYVEKDTVVNSLSYKKIMCRTGLTYNGGLLREDLNKGEVYYRDVKLTLDNYPSDTVEQVIFKYGLQIGDTFQGHQVDSVKIISGLRYVYFDFRVGDEPYAIIEGVGSNRGILWQRQGGGMFNHYLLCSYKDAVKTGYSNLRYEGKCEHPTQVRKEPLFETAIAMYPNPASRTIQFNNISAINIYQIIISGMDGRVYKRIDKDFSAPIAIDDIPKGYYQLSIIANGQKITKPLIIQ